MKSGQRAGSFGPISELCSESLPAFDQSSTMHAIQIRLFRRRGSREERRRKIRTSMPIPATRVDQHATLVRYFGDNGWGQIRIQSSDIWCF